MARVVQRRSSPPYLLIVFVFLFLVATALAVIFHVEAKDAIVARGQAQDDAAKAKKEAQALRDDTIPQLVNRLVGRAMDPKAAIDQTAEAINQYAGKHKSLDMASILQALNSDLAAQAKTIADLKREIERIQGDMGAKDLASKGIAASLHQEIGELKKQVKAAQDSCAAGIAEKDKQLGLAVAEKDKLIQEKEARVADQLKQIEQVGLDIQRRDARVAELLTEIKRLRPRIEAGTLAMCKPDGKIIQSLADKQLCYINLGEKENVRPGLSFSVYPGETGIPENGEGKAKLIVISVAPETAECRVLEYKRDDPIVDGDLVANLVYNTDRPNRFVVKGEFDLYGEGRPQPSGAKRIKDIIERFGGVVTEQVGIGTDFVILGDSPAPPTKLSDTATPQEVQWFNEQTKRVAEWTSVHDEAVSLQIPILNTSRFLAFSGYVPRKNIE